MMSLKMVQGFDAFDRGILNGMTLQTNQLLFQHRKGGETKTCIPWPGLSFAMNEKAQPGKKRAKINPPAPFYILDIQ